MNRFEQNYLTRKHNEKLYSYERDPNKSGKLSRDLVLIAPDGSEKTMTRQEAIDFIGTVNVTSNIKKGQDTVNVTNRFTGEVYKVKYA